MIVLNKHPQEYLREKIQSGDEKYVKYQEEYLDFQKKLLVKLESYQMDVKEHDIFIDDKLKHKYHVTPRIFDDIHLDHPIQISSEIMIMDKEGEEMLTTRFKVACSFFKEDEQFIPSTQRFEKVFNFYPGESRVYHIRDFNRFLEDFRDILSYRKYHPFVRDEPLGTPMFTITRRAIEAVKEFNGKRSAGEKAYTMEDFVRYFDNMFLFSIFRFNVDYRHTYFEFLIDATDGEEKQFLLSVIDRKKECVIGQVELNVEDYLMRRPPNSSRRFIHLRSQIEMIFSKYLDLKDVETQRIFNETVKGYWFNVIMGNRLNFEEDKSTLTTHFEAGHLVIEHRLHGVFETNFVFRHPVRPDTTFFSLLYETEDVIQQILRRVRSFGQTASEMQRIGRIIDGIYFAWPVGNFVRIHENGVVGNIYFRLGEGYFIELYPFVEGQSRYVITDSKEEVKAFFQSLMERKRSVSLVTNFSMNFYPKDASPAGQEVKEAKAFFDKVLVKEQHGDTVKSKWMDFDEYLTFIETTETDGFGNHQ